MTKKEQLYYLIDEFVHGRYDVETFCRAFEDVFYPDIPRGELNADELAVFTELAETVSRYTPFVEDQKAYPMAYRTEEEVREAISKAATLLHKDESMEQLHNAELILHIFHIEKIVCGDQELEIYFQSKDKKRYKLYFGFAWDVHYAIENGWIERFCQFRKNLPDDLIDNSFYIVENSKNIDAFVKELSGTYPTDRLVDYIISDEIDTTIEVITSGIEKPILIELDDEQT